MKQSLSFFFVACMLYNAQNLQSANHEPTKNEVTEYIRSILNATNPLTLTSNCHTEHQWKNPYGTVKQSVLIGPKELIHRNQELLLHTTEQRPCETGYDPIFNDTPMHPINHPTIDPEEIGNLVTELVDPNFQEIVTAIILAKTSGIIKCRSSLQNPELLCTTYKFSSESITPIRPNNITPEFSSNIIQSMEDILNSRKKGVIHGFNKTNKENDWEKGLIVTSDDNKKRFLFTSIHDRPRGEDGRFVEEERLANTKISSSHVFVGKNEETLREIVESSNIAPSFKELVISLLLGQRSGTISSEQSIKNNNVFHTRGTFAK